MKRQFYRLMEQAGTENTGGSTDASQTTNNAQSGTGANSGGQASSENTGFSVESLPKEAQDLIKNLRSENAKYRTEKNNFQTRLENIENGFKQMFGGDGEGQALTPEQKIEQLQGGYESLSFQNAIMGIAYENGIPMNNFEYFNFLMDKEVNALQEGQELSEDALLSIIQKAKGFNQAQSNANSSVDGNGNGGNKGPDHSTGLTLEAFTKMSLTEKSELYRKQPELYNQYMKQAREKRLL